MYRISTSTTRSVNDDAKPPTQPTEARAHRHHPEFGMELGHHQAARTGQVDLLHLYVILDIYSRYAVGWMLARVERAELSKRLTPTPSSNRAWPRISSPHSDRGSPMIAKPVAHLLADLGVTKSHSRPHVSNDNPYSESQFRTFKYRPDFPDRFGSSRMPAPTVPDSSAGTTTTTGIRASACTLRLMSTTAEPKRSEIDVEWSSWTLRQHPERSSQTPPTRERRKEERGPTERGYLDSERIDRNRPLTLRGAGCPDRDRRISSSVIRSISGSMPQRS